MHYTIEHTTKSGWILPTLWVWQPVVFECPDKPTNHHHQYPGHCQQWWDNQAVQEQTTVQSIPNQEEVE